MLVCIFLHHKEKKKNLAEKVLFLRMGGKNIAGCGYGLETFLHTTIRNKLFRVFR